MRLKIAWRSLRFRLSAISTFARAFRSSRAWHYTETAWRDCCGRTKVRSSVTSLLESGSKDIIGKCAIFFASSAQSARTGVSRDSSPHNGLRYRPAAVAHVHQVAPEIVRDNDHVSIALQRQSFIELQQESRIASSETAICCRPP